MCQVHRFLERYLLVMMYVLWQDYEVALSLGHLASLYNYDMERYSSAEGLYLRSIAIGK